MQHVIGPCTLANSNSQRANSVLDIPLRYGLAARNTYNSESSVGGDIWTLTWKGDASVHRQIDYMFASRSLVVDCFVDYNVDCDSDHKPVVAVTQEPIMSQGIFQHRSMKGWRPRDAKEATKFNELMLDLPVGATSQEFQTMLSKTMGSVKFTILAQRRKLFKLHEPANVLEARQCLASSGTPEDKLKWSRTLYRRRRRWLNFSAWQRYELSAMSLGRTDRACHSVRWLGNDEGEQVRDVTRWPELTTAFFQDLCSFDIENAAQKRDRWDKMMALCRNLQREGK